MATTPRVWPAAALVAALGLLGSCADDLPTTPTELAQGVTFCQQANFMGASALLTRLHHVDSCAADLGRPFRAGTLPSARRLH
jgi:hypothetical protein